MKCIVVVVLSFLPFLVSSYYVKIGILTDDPNTIKIQKVWSMAQNYSTMMSLDPKVQLTQFWRNIDVAKAVCKVVDLGVDALVFLGPSRLNHLISSYSTHLGLPLITALDTNEDVGKFQVNMMPDTSDAVADFIQHFKWTRFSFIYDTDNGPNQLQKLHRTLLSKGFTLQVETFWKASDAEQANHYIRDLLQPISNRRIVLATSERFADELAAKLARSRGFNMLLLTPVGTVEASSGQGFYKLTKLSVVDEKDELLETLENRLRTLPSYFTRGRKDKNLPDSIVLHYDSSSTLNVMFNKIAREIPEALKAKKPTNCFDFTTNNSKIGNYAKKVVIEHAATGKIRFDEYGQRINYKINIMQTTPFDVQKIGSWSDRMGLQLAPEYSKATLEPTYAAYRNIRAVKVTSIVVEPFLQRTQNGGFEGYVVDFLDLLFKEIKMTYQLEVVKDGSYGYATKNGKWNGMIGELERGEADIAVAPLTKTPRRAKVVDFSMNFMTTGINILVKKSEMDMDMGTFGPFAFISVWSVETWMVVLVAVVIYSAAGYGISRFIGSPDRVRALETKGTDNLSPCGSVWLTIGSLFCRDTGIYPRTLTHRIWALFWWIFCIFICLMYVSMLTADLIQARTTTTTTHSRKTSQQVMKELFDRGVPAIGVVNSGSTLNFFLNSEIGLYRQYGHYLQENPEVTTNSYAEGIERVKKSKGDYAFIMESSTSQLVADTEPCDTLVTSGYLNIRNYAVTLQKNSTLKDAIDHGILRLMENGVLRHLTEKWWHNISNSCEDPYLNILPKVYNNSLTLHEVSGIFYLLFAFIVISFIVTAIEYYIRTRNMRME